MAGFKDKESIISFILVELNGVDNSRAEILTKVVKKWQMSDRTFDRVWKIAQQRHTDTQKTIQNNIANIDKDQKEKLQNKHNITRDSLVTELNEVKELAKIPDQFGKINATAVIKAIEVQAKLLGLNEAEKSNITILKGADDLFIEE
jgi:hypothetical protein